MEPIKVEYYEDAEGAGWTGWIEIGGAILWFKPGCILAWAERDDKGGVIGDPLKVKF